MVEDKEKDEAQSKKGNKGETVEEILEVNPDSKNLSYTALCEIDLRLLCADSILSLMQSRDGFFCDGSGEAIALELRRLLDEVSALLHDATPVDSDDNVRKMSVLT